MQQISTFFRPAADWTELIFFAFKAEVANMGSSERFGCPKVLGMISQHRNIFEKRSLLQESLKKRPTRPQLEEAGLFLTAFSPEIPLFSRTCYPTN
jgi:hypothetical protein